MSTSQDEQYCPWCEINFLTEFDLKTGKLTKLTNCECDNALIRESSKVACLQSGLEAIVEGTDESPEKIAEETLSAFAEIK